MLIKEKISGKIKHLLRVLLPVLLLAGLCAAFLLGVARVSDQTLLKEQETLTQALRSGAVHTYALTGQYPQSLDELLSDYHITYDSSKFIVEYVPGGANLFPSISVLPRTTKKGGSL